MQRTNSNPEEVTIKKVATPEGFRKNLKKAKILCLFERGCCDFEQIAKYNLKVSVTKKYYKNFTEQRSFIKKQSIPKKIQEEHQKCLIDFISLPERVTSTLTEMRDHIMQNFDFKDNKLSIVSVSKTLSELGYTRKKVTHILEKRNADETKLRRREVVLEMTQLIYHKKEIIYLDESSFHIGMCLQYGYSEKGKKAIVISQPKSINYSLLAAICDDGVLGFQVFKGGVKSEDFNGFMANLITHLKLDEIEREVIFFMDNASIHKNYDLKANIATQVAIVYNAPYSPFLNPIEECFSLWKHHVRRRHPQDERDLVQSILSSAHEISSAHCKNFISHSIKLYPDCFIQKDIF